MTSAPPETAHGDDTKPDDTTPPGLGPTASEALRGVRAPSDVEIDGGRTDLVRAEEGPQSTFTDPGHGTFVAADRSVPALGGGTSWASRIALGIMLLGGAGAVVVGGGGSEGEAVADASPVFRETAASAHDLPSVRASRGPAVSDPIAARRSSDFDWAGLALGSRPDPHDFDRALAAREAAMSTTPRTGGQAPASATREARRQRRAADSLVFDASARVPVATSTEARGAPPPDGEHEGSSHAAPLTLPASHTLGASEGMMAMPATSSGLTTATEWRPQQHVASAPAGGYPAPVEYAGARFGEGPVTSGATVATVLPNTDTLLTQGTTIAGVLETAIQSDLPGMIRAVTAHDVYGQSGRRVLVPAGSTLVGRYVSGLRTGQRRVRVEWTRLERPDGIVVALDSPGTDALGRAGLGGERNARTFERLGAGFLFSVIGAGVALLDGEGDSRAERDLYRSSGDQLSRAAAIALEDGLDIPPTLHVQQGTRLTIFVARDLDFASALGVR